MSDSWPKPAAVKHVIPRVEGGRFAPGNGGRPKGTRSWVNRQLAEACRALFERHAPGKLVELLEQNEDLAVKLRTLEFLADRGWGKSQQIVKLAGIDPDSPEGILLALAGQPIPGLLLTDGSQE